MFVPRERGNEETRDCGGQHASDLIAALMGANRRNQTGHRHRQHDGEPDERVLITH
jgi:hypothetical protein